MVGWEVLVFVLECFATFWVRLSEYRVCAYIMCYFVSKIGDKDKERAIREKDQP